MSSGKPLRRVRRNRSEFLQQLEKRVMLAAGDMRMALSAGGAGSDFGKSTAIDRNGNAYVFGFFAGTSDFDPGPGRVQLTAQGNTDDFLAKYSSSGTLLWVKQIGGPLAENAERMAIDAAGNVLLTGYFQGTADLDPGAGIAQLTATGSTDAFVEKLDSSGNLLWVRALSGPGSDHGIDVAVDSSGNVYAVATAKITGYRPAPGNEGGPSQPDDSVGMTDGEGSAARTAATTGTVTFTGGGGAWDSFVVKFDSDGNWQWTAGLNGVSNDLATGLTVDTAGNVITTGYYLGPIDFDPGPGVRMMQPIGGNDTFVWKLSPKRDLLFAGDIGGWSQDIAMDVATDRSDNIYVTGYFFANPDFDMGPGVSTLTSTGGEDVFLAKYTPTGGLLFARHMGGVTDENPTGIAIDPTSAVVYLTGRFTGTADFDPGAGVFNLVSRGADDIFINAIRASDGTFLYAQGYGSSGNDYGYSVTTDLAGRVFTTGTFVGSVDFDPGPGASMHTSAGAEDFFLSELSGFSIFANPDMHEPSFLEPIVS